jgi:hypothetical protein
VTQDRVAGKLTPVHFPEKETAPQAEFHAGRDATLPAYSFQIQSTANRKALVAGKIDFAANFGVAFLQDGELIPLSPQVTSR